MAIEAADTPPLTARFFPPEAGDATPPETEALPVVHTFTVTPAATTTAHAIVPEAEPKLMVADSLARYNGRTITLGERDTKDIASIVLKAMHRETTNELKELGVATPRRRRKDVVPRKRKAVAS